MMGTTRLRVRARRDRWGFDGETGVLVLAGTSGEVSALTVTTRHGGAPGTWPAGEKTAPRLTVFWDHALTQVATNNEPTGVTEGWEEDGIAPADVEFVEAAAVRS